MTADSPSDARRVVVATRNPHKVRELERLLGSLDVTLLSLASFPTAPEVLEDGATFEANACKKASEVAQATGLPALADDSGLEVDALDGAPGVYSARYAGEQATDSQNNRKLLAELAGKAQSQRTARFRCALAFADPAGALGHDVSIVMGTVEGHVAAAPRGAGGFGYDPIFVPEGHTQTFAELGADVKHSMSHRARAVAQFAALLSDYWQD